MTGTELKLDQVPRGKSKRHLGRSESSFLGLSSKQQGGRELDATLAGCAATAPHCFPAPPLSHLAPLPLPPATPLLTQLREPAPLAVVQVAPESVLRYRLPPPSAARMREPSLLMATDTCGRSPLSFVTCLERKKERSCLDHAKPSHSLPTYCTLSGFLRRHSASLCDASGMPPPKPPR